MQYFMCYVAILLCIGGCQLPGHAAFSQSDEHKVAHSKEVFHVKLKADSLAFSPNSNFLAVGTDILHVFDLRTGKLLFRRSDAGGYIGALCWIDDHRLISGSCDEDGSPGMCIIWDISKGTKRQIGGEIRCGTNNASLIGSEALISGCTEDGTWGCVALVNLVDHTVKRRKKVKNLWSASSHIGSGQILIAIGKTLVELGRSNLQEVRRKEFPANVIDVRIVPNGKYVFVVASDVYSGSAVLYRLDAKTLKVANRIQISSTLAGTMAVSPQGNAVILYGMGGAPPPNDKPCKVFSIDDCGKWTSKAVEVDSISDGNVAWSPDGKLIATAADDGDVVVRIAPK